MQTPSSGTCGGVPFCAAGCGQRAVHLHHITYRQELRRIARDAKAYGALCADSRNLLPVCVQCHAATHTGTRRIDLAMLPDAAFVFAREVLGAGYAYEWLIRRYSGVDPRADALLAEWEQAA